jgi:hypothetical protein
MNPFRRDRPYLQTMRTRPETEVSLWHDKGRDGSVCTKGGFTDGFQRCTSAEASVCGDAGDEALARVMAGFSAVGSCCAGEAVSFGSGAGLAKMRDKGLASSIEPSDVRVQALDSPHAAAAIESPSILAIPSARRVLPVMQASYQKYRVGMN